MDKIIETCTRLEGHGNLNFIFKSEELTHTEFSFSLYRGFENLLIGKKLSDLPKIVSRVCGLCYSSQTIASCKAIEDIYGIEPSIKSIILRRILMTAELIRSHLLHFFYQTFPDLLHIFNIAKNINNPYAVFNYNDQFTTNVYNLLKISSDINRLIGGRVTHPITVIPGGIVNNPRKNELLIIQKQLKRARDYARNLIDFACNLFSKEAPPKEFEISDTYLLGLSNEDFYSRYEGNIIIKNLASKSQIFEPSRYKEIFDKSPELYGINFRDITANQVLTGPYARFQIKNTYAYDVISEYVTQFENSWKNNLLFINFLQLFEVFIEIIRSIELLPDDFINSKWAITPLKTIKKKEGIGLVEAPRGLLLHHYQINDHEQIKSAKLFIATEFNLPIINEMIAKYARELFSKQDINTVKEKVQMMVRCFDPCISCLSH
jgi:coenzyme F420-reducing hydrogenase alpha subunit